RWLLAVFAIVNFLLLSGERVALRLLSRWVRARGYNFRTVLLVGTGPKASQLADFIEAHPHWGFRVLGYLDDHNGGEIHRSNQWDCLGQIGDLETVLRQEVIDEVIFVIEKGKLGDYEHALLVAERHGVRAHVSLDIFPHVLARPVLEELDGVPLLTFTTTPSNPAQLVAKRALDLGLSLVLFLLTLPIQALAALAIKLTSPGPSFFRQVRCGLNGRHFTLVKFRTMEAGAEERRSEIAHLNGMFGPVLKAARDPRLTLVGRLLSRRARSSVASAAGAICRRCRFAATRALSTATNRRLRTCSAWSTSSAWSSEAIGCSTSDAGRGRWSRDCSSASIEKGLTWASTSIARRSSGASADTARIRVAGSRSPASSRRTRLPGAAPRSRAIPSRLTMESA